MFINAILIALMMIMAILFIAFMARLHPALGVSFGILSILGIGAFIFIPPETANLVNDTKSNYERLFDTANNSLIKNGGISETLYNQMKVHNLEVEKIEENLNTKRLNFQKDDYVFDLSQYPILDSKKTEETIQPSTIIQIEGRVIMTEEKTSEKEIAE